MLECHVTEIRPIKRQHITGAV